MAKKKVKPQISGFRILRDGKRYDVKAQDPKEANKIVSNLISSKQKK